MIEKFKDNCNISFVDKNGLVILKFNKLKKFEDVLTHCFTTRYGGVSKGDFESLNMGINRGDDRESVEENYKRLANAVGVEYESFVFSSQVHESKVRVVDESDKGKGLIRESDIKGYDALVTDKKGVTLVTFYADCVPVFFFDPVKKAIGLAHSGWRGTARQIALETVRKMSGEFGTEPKDIVAAIGPSIGECCFEVGHEVFEEFSRELPWSSGFCEQKTGGKYHINLWEIIKRTLIDSGIKEENVCISEICTKCNNDVFFSYRGSGGKTGTLAALMQLR